MRTKTIIRNPNYYQPGMAANVYAGKNIPIRQQKIVTKSTRKGLKVKTVDYSPVNYYGQQTRTKSKVYR